MVQTPEIIEGTRIGTGLKFAIVVSRFNELITKQLLDGSMDALARHGVERNHIRIAWVPGSFEIPLVAKVMAADPNYHAVICLGAVIRGSTAHFDQVVSAVTSGVSQVALQTHKPVIFGVLTTDTIEQAIERAGTKLGNKGFDAAVSAIEMAQLMAELSKKG